jgi:hypothetical protein
MASTGRPGAIRYRGGWEGTEHHLGRTRWWNGRPYPPCMLIIARSLPIPMNSTGRSLVVFCAVVSRAALTGRLPPTAGTG